MCVEAEESVNKPLMKYNLVMITATHIFLLGYMHYMCDTVHAETLPCAVVSLSKFSVCCA